MKVLFKLGLLLAINAIIYSCHSTPSASHSEKVKMDDIDKAMYHEFLMTRDPQLNTIPRERLQTAKEIARTLQSSMTRTTALTWQERGPTTIGGRTRAMIIDKRGVTGDTVLAGSVSGGIFRSTNFTSGTPTWAPVNDQMLNLAITAMVQDSTNPNIMYAGTGEGWFNIDAVKGAGIFKSTDGGITWTLLPSTSSFEFVQDIITDRFGNVCASLRNQTGTVRGVQRSTNGGTTWTQVLGLPLAGFATGRAADLEVASNGDLYATLGIFSRSQVLKSVFATHGANTGAAGTWVDITPAHFNVTQRAEIAVAPSNPQRLYLLLQDSVSQGVPTIYRSSNSGATWDSLPAPDAILNGGAAQAWYNLIAAVNPANPDDVTIGALRIGRSTDAGASWADINSSVHVDQHMFLYNGATNLYVGNDGGVYYSANANQPTVAFANKNNGYNVTQYYACDYHPTNADYFLAGAQDNRTQKFTTPGINAGQSVAQGDGGFPHIDQTDGQFQIAAAQYNNYYRSLNGGTSFTFVGGISNSRGLFINPSDYDDEQNILYTGDDAGQYYVISNWTGTPSGSIKTLTQLGSSRQVSAVKVDPFSTNTVWLGTTTSDNATTDAIPLVLKLTNANTTPSVSINSSLPVAAGATVSSIDVDPANANHILVTLSNYGVVSVLESTNGGTGWNNIEGNLPDMPIRWGIFAAPTAQLNGPTGGNGGILLGTELGVWTTSQISGGATQWIPNNGGLPNVRTDQLKYRTSDGLVAAATHGRGLFTTILTGGIITGLPSIPVTKGFIKYVSASTNNLMIVTGTLNTRKIDIRIFDMRGSEIYKANKNYQRTDVPLSAFSTGSYIIQITGDKKESYTAQFIKK